jgi:adenylate kinase family enzyme
MRVLIIGTSGSGKTTLARKLAKDFGLPHLELDSIYWQRGWKPVDERVFFDRLTTFTLQTNWIIEGDYDLGRNLLFSKADVILWLDLPPFMIFYRLIKRSIARLYKKEVLWGGNRETWRGIFFGKDSLIRWFFKSQRRARILYPELLSAAENRDIKTVRLHSSNWPNEAATVLEDLLSEHGLQMRHTLSHPVS